MRAFFSLPDTNSVRQFLQKIHFLIFHIFAWPPQKTLFFIGFLGSFPFFFFFLFLFLQHKKDKNKKCNFLFENLIFDIPKILQNHYVGTVWHYLCFQKYQKHYKNGENSEKDESPHAPPPYTSARGLAIASLWERLLVCYGITGYEPTQTGHCSSGSSEKCGRRSSSRSATSAGPGFDGWITACSMVICTSRQYGWWSPA